MALHLELGNRSNCQESKSKIWSILFIPKTNATYPRLVDEWVAAWDKLWQITVRLEETTVTPGKKNSKKLKKLETTIPQQQEELDQKCQAVDYYNRHSVFVHGASPDTYGILKMMGIEQEFATLLQITMPSPDNKDQEIQHMFPLKWLAVDFGYVEWMPEYCKDDEDVLMSEL
jgi:hypothetical protein